MHPSPRESHPIVIGQCKIGFTAFRYLPAVNADRPEDFVQLAEHEVVRRYLAEGSIRTADASYGFTATIVPLTREVLSAMRAVCSHTGFKLHLTEDVEYSIAANHLAQGGGEWSVSLCGPSSDIATGAQTTDGLLLTLTNVVCELRRLCFDAGIEYIALLGCCPGEVSLVEALSCCT
jgi:hypothetical protein